MQAPAELEDLLQGCHLAREESFELLAVFGEDLAQDVEFKLVTGIARANCRNFLLQDYMEGSGFLAELVNELNQRVGSDGIQRNSPRGTSVWT